jgi:hypothetical protein
MHATKLVIATLVGLAALAPVASAHGHATFVGCPYLGKLGPNGNTNPVCVTRGLYVYTEVVDGQHAKVCQAGTGGAGEEQPESTPGNDAQEQFLPGGSLTGDNGQSGAYSDDTCVGA